MREVPRYRFLGAVRTKLPSGAELLRGMADPRAQILSREAAFAATRAVRFASLDDHAAYAQSTWPGAPRPAEEWRRYLTEAVAGGLLLSEGDARARLLLAFGCPRPRVAIDRVAIPTRNRPEHLSYLLRDLAEQSRMFCHSFTVLVVDDSTNGLAAAQNRQIIVDVQREHPDLRIDYAGSCERSRFAAELARLTGIPESVVSFGISGCGCFPVSVGACRNAALLATTGHGLLFMDDDVRCRLARLPESGNDIVIGSGNAAFETWFLDGTEAAMPTVHIEDVVGLHEDSLNAGPALFEFGDTGDCQPDLSGVGWPLLKRIQSGAAVVTSFMGVVGDAALDSPLMYYLQSSETLARFTANPDDYQRALSSYRVLRGPQRRVLSEEIGGFGYCMAVNNTEVLPPFLPVQRGEELVFCSLVKGCVPGALSMALPRAILHAPPTGRRRERFDPGLAVGRFGASTVLTCAIAQMSACGVTRSELMQSTASRQREISVLPDAQLREWLRDATEPLLAQWVRRLDVAVRSSSGSSFFTADAARIRDTMISSWNEWDHSVPSDLGQIWGVEEGRRRFRVLLQDFAAFLEVWPILVEGSRSLRSAGHGMCASEDNWDAAGAST